MPRKQVAKKRPLLIGESPSKSGDRYWQFPLSGRVAKTLCELAEIPPQDEGSRYGRWTWALYDHFECVNLFERYASFTAPGWQGRGVQNAARIIGETKGDSLVIVCLGRKVQAAVLRYFGEHVAFGGSDFYDWNIGERPTDKKLVDFVTIPHPSGLNRLLNDAEHREQCAAALQEAMHRA